MALKGKWALKWVMLSVPILVKLEFFQHPREDVIEVCMYHFCDYHFSTIFRIRVSPTFYLMLALFLGIFFVLNQSMSVKIIFIYSNENDGFHIKIIIFWSEKPAERSRHQFASEFPKGFSKIQLFRKRLVLGRIYTDTKNDQRTLALQM